MDYGGFVRKGIIVAKMMKESVSFAVQQLRGDRLRTFLSLFGVTIGIFSIVAIFTAIDALQESTRRGFEVLGSDVVMVSKYPFAPEDEQTGELSVSSEYKWWEYMRRPPLTEDDFNFLKEHSQYAEHLSMIVQFWKNVRYGRVSVSDCYLAAVTYDWNNISPFGIEEGRYFTNEECDRGLPVAIVGYDVARELFGELPPVGKIIKVGGLPVRVIGMIEKQGNSIVSLLMYDIYIKPYSHVESEDFTDEVTMLLRNSRRLSPEERNDFSVNRMTFITSIVDNVFSSLSAAGWIIAGFSLLIGGFGIANIMFVSVKERTHIPGIQKAMGAKRYFILSQFLSEAIFLSLLGGAAGILLVCLIVPFVPKSELLTIGISFYNILSGLLIATVIGIISGIVPAMQGASLNPVEAINSK